MRDLVSELLPALVKPQLGGGEPAPTLGRLVLLERLGAGALGPVFPANFPRLDRMVADKVWPNTDDAARVLAAYDRVLSEDFVRWK